MKKRQSSQQWTHPSAAVRGKPTKYQGQNDMQYWESKNIPLREYSNCSSGSLLLLLLLLLFFNKIDSNLEETRLSPTVSKFYFDFCVAGCLPGGTNQFPCASSSLLIINQNKVLFQPDISASIRTFFFDFLFSSRPAWSCVFCSIFLRLFARFCEFNVLL